MTCEHTSGAFALNICMGPWTWQHHCQSLTPPAVVSVVLIVVIFLLIVLIVCIITVLNHKCCIVQGNLADEGELLRKDVFSVWNHKKDQRSLRFTSQTRHVFLYERRVVFCKKKDDVPSNTDKPVIYTLKSSIPVSHCLQLFM